MQILSENSVPSLCVFENGAHKSLYSFNIICQLLTLTETFAGDLVLVNLWLSGAYRVTGQVSPCFLYPCSRGLPGPVACLTPRSEAWTRGSSFCILHAAFFMASALLGLSCWSGLLLPSRFFCLDL